MSSEGRESRLAPVKGEGTNRSGNAGGTGNSFVLMEQIKEKLSLLNYEETAASTDHGRALVRFISPVHFALAPGPESNNKILFDQFCATCNFLLLKVWQARGEGGAVDVGMDEEDTPNNRVNEILVEVKSLGYETPTSAYRMVKTAYGPDVCALLNFLCDQALSSGGFRWVSLAGFGVSSLVDKVRRGRLFVRGEKRGGGRTCSPAVVELLGSAPLLRCVAVLDAMRCDAMGWDGM